VLAELDVDLKAPTSVRETGFTPWSKPSSDLAADLPGFVADELSAVDGGTVAVLTPESRAEAVGELLGEEDERVSVLTVERAKGLEFDSVLVVAPDEITGGSPRGLNDLYVALTRATRRLGVVRTGDAVPALGGLG
jgi:hypothetical protein